jgi:hypothetical protein
MQINSNNTVNEENFDADPYSYLTKISEDRNILCRMRTSDHLLITEKEMGGWVMVFNATFNNTSVQSWQSAILVEETRVPGENHRPAVSH